MDALAIINKYYPEDNELKHILLAHSRSVADKALWIAGKHPELNLDKQFLEEAAMLHDIGIFMTDAEGICCFGSYPYICHGYLGADLMRKEGFRVMHWSVKDIRERVCLCKVLLTSSCLFLIGIWFRFRWKNRLFALPTSFSQRRIWTGKRAWRRR